MTMPKRIHQRRTKGWRMPPGAKSVARPHRWGNRYSVEEYGRDEALRLFEHVHMTPERRAAAKRELRGYDLACFCPLNQPCHADILLRIANSGD
jgi:hypothetical protein